MKFILQAKEGSGRGKSLGFPTINFDISNIMLSLSKHGEDYGIYRCFVSGLLGALYYGPREMFGEHEPSFEVHLIEGASELPTDSSGKSFEIDIREKIRDIEKFPSEEVLKKAIAEDLETIKNMDRESPTIARLRSAPLRVFDYLRQKINPQNPLLLLYHKVMAFLAAALYGFPAKDLTVVGVTGTSGKTTTVMFIASILEEFFGDKIGVLSSVFVKTGTREIENITKITSFSRLPLNRFLKEMKENNCKAVVMEVTSHALAQSRLAGIPIDAAVLTNLSGDHLEYHGGFELYKKAKMKLFEMLSKTRPHRSLKKISVLPRDDAYGEVFEKFPAERKISFGIQDAPDVRASEISYFPDSTIFTLHCGSQKIPIKLCLPGKTNVKNALAAASVAYGWEISIETVKRGLEKISNMPGRYESIQCSETQNFTIIVDYAHTPKALEELCAFYRPLTKGKLIIVFGATGGGRDKSKRPFMGEVVSKYCDVVIVTDDDPYEEDRFAIIEQVSSGVKNKKEGESLFKILGRRSAIEKALSLCEKADTLLIAGKGCEKIWIVGKEKIPWDDREVVKQLYFNPSS